MQAWEGKGGGMVRTQIWVRIYTICAVFGMQSHVNVDICIKPILHLFFWLQFPINGCWQIRTKMTDKQAVHNFETNWEKSKCLHFTVGGIFLSCESKTLLFFVLSHCTVSLIPACFCWSRDSASSTEKACCFNRIWWRPKLPVENHNFSLCSKFRNDHETFISKIIAVWVEDTILKKRQK